MLFGLVQLAKDAGLYCLYIMVQLRDLHLVDGHLLLEGLDTSFDEVQGLAHGFETGEKRRLAVYNVGQADSQSDCFAIFP